MGNDSFCLNRALVSAKSCAFVGSHFIRDLACNCGRVTAQGPDHLEPLRLASLSTSPFRGDCLEKWTPFSLPLKGRRPRWRRGRRGSTAWTLSCNVSDGGDASRRVRWMFMGSTARSATSTTATACVTAGPAVLCRSSPGTFSASPCWSLAASACASSPISAISHTRRELFPRRRAWCGCPMCGRRMVRLRRNMKRRKV